ncbi:MAG: hypothetical protein R2845_00150 [Thermomicrobiales bacterium]
MSVFDPTTGQLKAPHGGTFNANPVSMTAGKVALEKLTREEFARLDRLGEELRAGIAETLDRNGIDGQVTGAGSLFTIHFHDRPLVDYRSSILTRKSSPSRPESIAPCSQTAFFSRPASPDA